MAGQYQAILDKAEQRARLHANDQSGWKLSGKSNDKIKIESKESDLLNCSIWRTTASVNATPEVVWQTLALKPDTKRFEWDQDMKSIETLQAIKDNIWIQHITTNAVFKGLISPREMIDVVNVIWEGNGFFFYGGAVNDYTSPSASGKFVRGESATFAFSAFPDPGNPKLSKVMTITELDLKGKIPKYILDSAFPHVSQAAHEKWVKYLGTKGLLTA